MHAVRTSRTSRTSLLGCAWLAALALTACGGGTGTERDSGITKTYLNVEATDANADTLRYQWRVTGGSIENRDARSTVWTMPDGPGLHFAYVTVSDGRGGYVEQQYSVSSDTLGTAVPARPARSYAAPAATAAEGSAARLRLSFGSTLMFSATGGAAERRVYLPDVQVRVIRASTQEVVHAGLSDLSGDVSLPKLVANARYELRCAMSAEGALRDCGSFDAPEAATILPAAPLLDDGQNLRLFGHVALSDGSVCGAQNDYFGLQSAATVQLVQADGTAVSKVLRVNRFGDYALDAPVAVDARLNLKLQCEGYAVTLTVPPASGTRGYSGAQPVELSHVIPNQRPRIVKVVATGPDGNVRGRMVVPEVDAASNGLPGPDRFLAYKGLDNKLSVCRYYRALGATRDCDAQGNMIEPIGFDDWLKQNAFVVDGPPPAAQVSAIYINRRDLNLVRRMVATSAVPGRVAFYVCNHPGPETSSQAEVDEIIARSAADEKRVACVAMEHSATAGANGGRPFTKFFTFAPDGSLLTSVNLDGRGEKFLPGACVACHGGTKYNGRFPDSGNASADVGAGFLPFDTGNFLFTSNNTLTEAAQHDAFFQLNALVRATEPSPDTATSRLIAGWYAGGGKKLDKDYVPPSWRQADAATGTAGAARFYREVVGTSCRTCHVALGARFDWDSQVLSASAVTTGHFCGGTSDLAINATMPNALMARDRLFDKVRTDPSLAALMKQFLGCDNPRPDPAYPLR